MKHNKSYTPRCKECNLLIYSKKRIKTKNKREWTHITCFKNKVENDINKKIFEDEIERFRDKILYDKNKSEIKVECESSIW